MSYGEGWTPWLVTTTACNVEDYSHRDLGETEIAGDRDSVLREIEALKIAGATSVQVMPPRVATFEQCLEWIEWYDSEIIPEFR